MGKKNQKPLKMVLGTVILVMAVVFGTHQSIKYFITSPGLTISTTNGFVRFLTMIFGLNSSPASKSYIYNQNGPANQNPTGAATSPGNNPVNGQNSGLLTAQGPDFAANSPSNNSAANADEKTTAVTDAISKDGTNSNAEYNADTNGVNNAENNSQQGINNANQEYSDQLNGTYNSDGNAQNNSENNPGGNAEQGPGNINTGNAPGNTSNQGPGNASASTAGDSSGPSADTGTVNSSLNNLPTINPIPSDSSVSQSITQQNQQQDNLSAILAARKALVVPVQQEAQASKFQTVDSNSIPAPSTNPAPDDAVKRMKSNGVMYH